MISRVHEPAKAASGSADDATTPVGDEPIALPFSPMPARLGRYVVVDEVGKGGMGRVLRAYDPKLHRVVALKLLFAGTHGSEGAARIEREAQAMAQLSHPNLVPVYDVEHDDDAVFIAMEYVEGETLRTWSKTKRSWRETVAAFVGAGRGLAAAHAAGIVHRDFKPANAIIGADGRVRVMDFGLARGVTASEEQSTDDDDMVLSELTQAGTVVGTPPYMAPEQHRREAIVPATDQYAFCVALFEGLFGERPFHGADLRALLQAKVRGVPEVPTGGRKSVPTWLYAAVVRGLAPRVEDRWPSMDDLLAALERGQQRARARRVLAGVGALGLTIATGVMVDRFDQRERTAACEAAGASIGEVWNDGTRQQLRAAMIATGVSHAETTAAKVAPWLDAQAAAWQSARNDACLDEDVRDEWSAGTLERALGCLDERRIELEALVDALVHADATAVQTAVNAAATLSPIDPCRDAALLERSPAPPSDRRDELRAIRVELARVDASEWTGKYAEALELARRAREHAALLEWPQLLAAAQLREARLLERQGEYAEAKRVDTEAYFAAAKHGAWDTAASAATHLVRVVGTRLTRHEEGVEWASHAEVALAYAGDPDGLREATRLQYLGSTELRAGDVARARDLYERAHAIRERILGPDHPGLAATLNNLANAYEDAADHERALALYRRSLAIQEQALGPEHPDVAGGISNIAIVMQASGQRKQAIELSERALALRERALGSDHVDVAKSLANLGNLYFVEGAHAKAIAMHERALAIWEKAVGPDHPDVAQTLLNLGNVYLQTGEHERARVLFERALAIMEKALGSDHVHIASVLNNLARVRLLSGDTAEARALAERAVAIRERVQGPDHPDLASNLYGLADIVAKTDARAARDLLERAVAIFDRKEGSQKNEATTRFALAQALVSTNGDRSRARTLAEQACEGFRAGGEPYAQELTQAESWLARQ